MADTPLERMIQSRSADDPERPAGQRLLNRLGYVIESTGSRLRAQACGIAILLTVSGRIDTMNVDVIGEHLLRFVELRGPLIVVMRADFDSHCCDELLETFDEHCRHARVAWVLIGEFADGISPRLPLVDSVETGSRHLFDQCRRITLDSTQSGGSAEPQASSRGQGANPIDDDRR